MFLLDVDDDDKLDVTLRKKQRFEMIKQITGESHLFFFLSVVRTKLAAKTEVVEGMRKLLAFNLLMKFYPVGFFSLEMSMEN